MSKRAADTQSVASARLPLVGTVDATPHIAHIDVAPAVLDHVTAIVRARDLFAGLRLVHITANAVALAAASKHGNVKRVMVWHVRAPAPFAGSGDKSVYIVCSLRGDGGCHRDALVFDVTSSSSEALDDCHAMRGGIEMVVGDGGDEYTRRGAPIAWPCHAEADVTWANEHWRRATAAIVERVYAQACAQVYAMMRDDHADQTLRGDMYGYLEQARFTEGTLAALWK